MKPGKIIGIIWVLVLIWAGQGLAKDEITWVTTHWPPLMELDQASGRITGGQYGNQLKQLQNSLPGYTHLNQEMRWNRFWYLLKKGEKVCSCMAYKNSEREAFTSFSIPISLILPNHIIMKKETFEQLGFPKSLSLITIMNDERFKGGLIESRSYSHEIDRILGKHEKLSNITRSVSDEPTFLKMLSRKRMDYILEYPFVVRDTVARHFPQLKGVFAYVPIAEIDPFFYVYVACPENEWGKAVIQKVDEALKRLRPSTAFRRELTQIYSGGQLDLVNAYYDRFLMLENN